MSVEGQLVHIPAQPQSAPRVDDGTDDPVDADHIQQQLGDKGTQNGIWEAIPRNLGDGEACDNNVHELTP